MSADELVEVSYSEVGGKESRAGVHAHEFNLRISIARRQIELVQHSPGAEREPTAIGVFRRPLDRDDAQALRRACRDVPSSASPPQGRGDFGASLITLRCVFKEHTHQAQFLSRNLREVQRHEALLEELNSVRAKALAAPLQAVQLDLSRGPGTDGRFKLAVRNIGTLPVAIVPPGRSTDSERTGVDVTPQPSGEDEIFTPAWHFIPLESTSAAEGKPATLAPKATLELMTGAWRGKKGEHYLAQARLAAYGGPPAYQGMPVIRGQLFSEAIQFVHP